jgi:filamentous hemagglutinin family protein
MHNTLLQAGFVLLTAGLLSNPQEHFIQEGVVSVTNRDHLLEITAGDKSIIHWQEFSIDPGEITRFIQPTQDSTVLNKVQGLNASLINGVLEANGRVILINPHGVVIGKEGVINTADFVVSTTDVLDHEWNLNRNLSVRIEGTGAAAINHQGHIEATGIEKSGGRVLLIAPEVKINGSIVADTVELLGDLIQLHDHAVVDVSHNFGAGTVLIGGDFQGKNPTVQNSRAVLMEEGAFIFANAKERGDGGRVVLWSDHGTDFRGKIEAKGGFEGGDGGFVEVSSPGMFFVTGLVDTTALQGKTGTVLFDPTDITISNAATSGNVVFVNPNYQFNVASVSANINAPNLQTQLGLSNVVIDTSAPILGTSTGTLTFQANSTITWATNNSLTLNSNSDMTIGGTLQCTAAGNVTINCGGTYTQHSNVAFFQSTIDAGSGNISITANGDIDIYGNNLGGGNSQLNTTGSGTITITSQNGSVNIGSLTQPSTVNASVQSTGSGGVNVTAKKDINISPARVGSGIAFVSAGGNLNMTAQTGLINVGDPLGQSANQCYAGSSKNTTLQAAGGINVTGGNGGGATAEILGGLNGFLTSVSTSSGNITVSTTTGTGLAVIGLSGLGEVDITVSNGDLIMNVDMGGRAQINSHDHIAINARNLSINTTGAASTIIIDVPSGTGAPSVMNLSGNFNALAAGSTDKYQLQFQNSFLTLNVGGDMNLNNTSSTAVISGISPLGLGANFNITGNLVINANSPLSSTRVLSNGPFNAHVGGNVTVENLQNSPVELLSATTFNLVAGGNILIQSASTPIAPPFPDAVVGVNSATTGPLTMIAGGNITLGRRAQVFIANNDTAFFRAQKNITMGFQSFIDSPTFAGGPNQSVTLVVDNQAPVSPQIGNGSFSMDPTAVIMTLAVPPVRIFTARRIQNSIQGAIVGAAFIPGAFGVNTPEEHWTVYYPQAFIGTPFTVFYKEPQAAVTIPNMLTSFAKLPVVLGNMFDVLGEFEYPPNYYRAYFTTTYDLMHGKGPWYGIIGRGGSEMPNTTKNWVQVLNYRKYNPYREKFGIRL